MRCLYLISCHCISLFMKLLLNYQVIGKDNVRNWKSCIIAANHISYNDPPLIGSILGIEGIEIFYFAKKELFKNFLLRTVLQFFNTIPVNRGLIDREALKNVKKVLTTGNSILIFPEGSRKSFTAKPGIGHLVYTTKTPILPIKLVNTNQTVKCLFRRKRAKIVIGKLIEPDKYLKTSVEKNSYRIIAEDILNIINNLDS